jgi:hypothetical protein
MCHFLRVLRWEIVGGPVQSVDAKVVWTASEMFQTQTPTAAAILQKLFAPVRQGGFVLTRKSK